MVYTYEMFDADGDEIAHGLGHAPRTTPRPSAPIPVEVRGRTYRLDPDDILVRAQGFFEAKYGREQGADFYLRWASVVTFARENADALERERIVDTDGGDVAGIDTGFVSMLLASYSPPLLVGSFPTSPLHEGDSGFSLEKCLAAWRTRRLR